MGPDGTIVVVIEDDKSPPEICAVVTNGERKPLTELGKEFVERYELPRIELVHWRSDDLEIEGTLTFPPGYQEDKPLPLVVQIHGGPKAISQNILRGYHQHPVWAAEGYLVFQPNFRGSAGYGNEFAVANRRDLGGGDFRDIMAGVDHLVSRGLADEQRMAIMGGSYGGYMTNWAIGQTDRFAAAISQFGMFSLITSTANSELARWEVEYLGAPYWEDPGSLSQVLSVHLSGSDQRLYSLFMAKSMRILSSATPRRCTTHFVVRRAATKNHRMRNASLFAQPIVRLFPKISDAPVAEEFRCDTFGCRFVSNMLGAVFTKLSV